MSIRTYHVQPLSETEGLLEWVPNTGGIRDLIQEQNVYEHQFHGTLPLEMSDAQKVRAKLENFNEFCNYLLPASAPALHLWFNF